MRLERHAVWRGLWEEGKEKEVEAAAEAEVSRSILACERWPPPRIETLFDDVYETVPWPLERQKDEYLQYLRRKEE